MAMSELHGYGLHMGAGWAAESLAQGHLKVLQAQGAMTVPLPEAELNSHGKRIDAGRQTGDGEKVEKDEKKVAVLHAEVLLSGI